MAKPRFARRPRHALEGALVAALFALFRLLPPALASGLGGALAGTLGPFLPVHARARRNLTRVLPDLSAGEIKRTLGEMWRNLGRVAGEYPHLSRLRAFPPGGHIEVVGEEHLEAAKRLPRGALFFTGHLGNWEAAALPMVQFGIPVAVVYRAPNNPFVDRLIRRARGAITETPIAKGTAGARQLVRQVKQGGYVAMVVDQKMNDGISVPFFGRDCMTAPALAQLALKYDVPVWPVRSERLRGCRFRVTIYPRLEISRSNDLARDVFETMRRVNLLLEGWIRERPGQWLWLHNRWPRED